MTVEDRIKRLKRFDTYILFITAVLAVAWFFVNSTLKTVLSLIAMLLFTVHVSIRREIKELEEVINDGAVQKG